MVLLGNISVYTIPFITANQALLLLLYLFHGVAKEEEEDGRRCRSPVLPAATTARDDGCVRGGGGVTPARARYNEGGICASGNCNPRH